VGTHFAKHVSKNSESGENVHYVGQD